MSMKAEAVTSKLRQEATVVDCDVHFEVEQDIRSPDYTLPEYVDPAYKSTLRSIYPWKVNASHDLFMGGKIDFTRVTDPEPIREELMDDYAVDHPIINAFFSPSECADRELGVQVMKGLNDLMIEEFLDYDDDILACAHIYNEEPHKTAEELDRIGDEDQIVAFYFGSSTPKWFAGDPKYDPIYQAAEDNDLQPIYHADNFINGPGFRDWDQMYQEWFSEWAVGHPASQMNAIASLIENGVPEKFPDLNFCFVEAGLGYIPYMMFRLNRGYHMRREELPLLEKTPEEYIRDQFIFGTEPIDEPNNVEHLKQLADIVGPECIAMASDWPHWDSDNPDAMTPFFEHFSEEESKQILGGNAIDAFNLDKVI